MPCQPLVWGIPSEEERLSIFKFVHDELGKRSNPIVEWGNKSSATVKRYIFDSKYLRIYKCYYIGYSGDLINKPDFYLCYEKYNIELGKII